MNESKALNTEQECEDYLFLKFPSVAQETLPYLKRLLPLLKRNIGSDLYKIKGYKRNDAIGFCIVENNDRIVERKVRTNFVVLKPRQRIVDFYQPGDPNNFAIIMGFDHFLGLSENQLNDQIGSSFSGRALEKGLSVQW